MFAPSTYSEADALVGFLEQQLASIRAAAYGLTEQQARETPCRSVLSVGGIVKHVTYVLNQRLHGRAAFDEAGFELFLSSFALGPDETLAATLDAFDTAQTGYLTDVRATDPAAPMTAPPAPWDGIYEPQASVQRFELLHHIEELARHAGHADIVREQIDGADAASLSMAAEGREGNGFVQPWTPQPRS